MDTHHKEARALPHEQRSTYTLPSGGTATSTLVLTHPAGMAEPFYRVHVTGIGGLSMSSDPLPEGKARELETGFVSMVLTLSNAVDAVATAANRAGLEAKVRLMITGGMTVEDVEAWLGEPGNIAGLADDGVEESVTRAFEAWDGEPGEQAWPEQVVEEICTLAERYLEGDLVPPTTGGWAAWNGERWKGCYATQEDAERAADCDGPAMVCPVTPGRVDSYMPSAEEILDLTSERVRDELYSDAEPVDASPEAVRELDDILALVFAAWAARHKVELPAFEVDEARAVTLGAGVHEGEQ